MRHTIIGVFDTYAEANKAAESLANAGISRNDIEVYGDDSDLDPVRTPVSATEYTDSNAQATVLERVQNFFSKLFGDDDEHRHESGHYAEAVRRGGSMVSVHVASENEVESTRFALWKAGAVDIDDRVARWKAAGYTGYDPTARPYTVDEIAAERAAFPAAPRPVEIEPGRTPGGCVRVYPRRG